MTKLDIKTKITAPSEITVPLIRADHHQISNIFRVCFEVFLAFSAAFLGNILSIESVPRLHWAVFFISGLSSLAFLILSFIYGKKSKSHRKK